MTTKKERSKAASILGKAGSKKLMKKYDAKTRREWARHGGQARAERHTREELQEFAATGGRKPWKMTRRIQTQVLSMLRKGRHHKEIAERFGISLRAIGRLVEKTPELRRLKGRTA